MHAYMHLHGPCDGIGHGVTPNLVVSRPSEHCNPFGGAFGNKPTDARAYRTAGAPLERIFNIDNTSHLSCAFPPELPSQSSASPAQTTWTSYVEMLGRIDELFPPAKEHLDAPHVQTSTIDVPYTTSDAAAQTERPSSPAAVGAAQVAALEHQTGDSLRQKEAGEPPIS